MKPGLNSLLLPPPDEREAVQKKTFTKWVNSILSRVGCRITDLYLDLRDGRMLIKLLEVLSGEKLVLHCTVLHCIALHCTTSATLTHITRHGLHNTARYCTAQHLPL